MINRRKKHINTIKYCPPIIGYDREFWAHCLEPECEKDRIIHLRQDSSKDEDSVLMQCDNGHVFKISPYTYFIDKRHCIHCKKDDEMGAINYDPIITEYWNDSYDLRLLSESSVQEYSFMCPICDNTFSCRMVDFLNREPKCRFCNDGHRNNTTDNADSTVYIYNK